MSDRRYCETCDRWIGGGVAHDDAEHVKQGIDDVLNGNVATKAEMREAFGLDPDKTPDPLSGVVTDE